MCRKGMAILALVWMGANAHAQTGMQQFQAWLQDTIFETPLAQTELIDDQHVVIASMDKYTYSSIGQRLFEQHLHRDKILVKNTTHNGSISLPVPIHYQQKLRVTALDGLDKSAEVTQTWDTLSFLEMDFSLKTEFRSTYGMVRLDGIEDGDIIDLQFEVRREKNANPSKNSFPRFPMVYGTNRVQALNRKMLFILQGGFLPTYHQNKAEFDLNVMTQTNHTIYEFKQKNLTDTNENEVGLKFQAIWQRVENPSKTYPYLGFEPLENRVVDSTQLGHIINRQILGVQNLEIRRAMPSYKKIKVSLDSASLRNLHNLYMAARGHSLSNSSDLEYEGLLYLATIRKVLMRNNIPFKAVVKPLNGFDRVHGLSDLSLSLQVLEDNVAYAFVLDPEAIRPEMKTGNSIRFTATRNLLMVNPEFNVAQP